jgi:hypothetical protein
MSSIQLFFDDAQNPAECPPTAHDEQGTFRVQARLDSEALGPGIRDTRSHPELLRPSTTPEPFHATIQRPIVPVRDLSTYGNRVMAARTLLMGIGFPDMLREEYLWLPMV